MNNFSTEMEISKMEITTPHGAIDLLFDGGYMTVDELLRDFASYGIILSRKDLENFMCLREGTLKHKEKIIPFMSVKKDNQ